MITVYNKQELQEALKNRGQKIRVEGSYANELAQKIHRKKKVSKAVMVGGAVVALGGLAAAPFTGGASLAGSAAGIAAMGFTAGAVTLTTAQLALILGVSASLLGYAIHNKYKIVIKRGKDGEIGVELEPK